MAIADVMTTDLPEVAPQDSLGEVARQMKQRRVKALPVCERDQLVGIITDWDLAMAMADEKTPADSNAADCMTTEIVTATPNTSFSEALELMGEHQIHHLMVSEQGHFAGMVHMDVEWEQFDSSVQAPMATFTGRI